MRKKKKTFFFCIKQKNKKDRTYIEQHILNNISYNNILHPETDRNLWPCSPGLNVMAMCNYWNNIYSRRVDIAKYIFYVLYLALVNIKPSQRLAMLSLFLVVTSTINLIFRSKSMLMWTRHAIAELRGHIAKYFSQIYL